MKKLAIIFSIVILIASIFTIPQVFAESGPILKGMLAHDRTKTISALDESGVSIQDKDKNAAMWVKDNQDIVMYPSEKLEITNGNIQLSASYDIEMSNEWTIDHLGSSGLEIKSAANRPFMIKTNNVERLRVLGTGNIGIGTTDDFLTGLTTHITFASGASPTGALTDAAGFYVYQQEMYAVSSKGDHTVLTSHDKDGNEVLFSYNVFTGKPFLFEIQKWLESGADIGTIANYHHNTWAEVTPIMGREAPEKLNPEEVFKEKWVENYQQSGPEIEVQLKDALMDQDFFESPEIESGETVYELKNGEVKEKWVKKTIKLEPVKVGTKKDLRPNHRLVEKGANGGKILRKPTLAEAQAACEAQWNSEDFWARQTQAVREAWGK